ncbi:dynein heavy chain 1, axonemal-like [Teleopsis dalmanni]|uniref:dynein heavy chain 1, axonemal-like n=1 Tax=Teleopsis dalmanni TaxID=139649 RepID=UPI0018CE1E54|nr:dynein heavy chain 1, axonemal-like [Teleopsis dalmanni]
MKKINQERSKQHNSGFLSVNYVGTQRNIDPNQIKSVRDRVEDTTINERLQIYTHFDLVSYENAVKWFTFQIPSGKIFFFPIETIQPKVQICRVVASKRLPRNVAEDRLRRLYSNYNLVNELNAVGVHHDDLLPTQEQFYNKIDSKRFKHFLPLSFFDDYNFDVHTPEAWLALGYVDGKHYSLIARAFIPMHGTDSVYDWKCVQVNDFNKANDMWHITCLETEIDYMVSKYQVMFFAESAKDFAQRLKQAIANRDDAELRIKIDSIIDCVILQDLQTNKPTFMFKTIRNLLRNYKNNMTFYNAICREVYVLHEHVMAYYDFDNFLKKFSQDFPGTKQEDIQHVMPKPNFPKVDLNMLMTVDFTMIRLRKKLFKQTLYYVNASVQAMKSVWRECIYVQTLSLFIYKPSKPLTLAEFEIEQYSLCESVSRYLLKPWPKKISDVVTNILRANGKGWLDICLNRWQVYEFSKIIRFVLQVKLRMESCLQMLLQQSVEMFINYLTQPCAKFLKLPTDYEWPHNEFIVSKFQWAEPIFSLEIIIDKNRKVYYSTAPELFETTLCQIFQDTVRSIGRIRCIDAKTMLKLRFPPNNYLMTIELAVELYMKSLDDLKLSYIKAILPLKSYCKQYERFVDICVLNVNEYMKEYEIKQNPSTTVKNDILEYRRQKEEIQRILPTNITIGPFLINVNPLKQYMIKKIRGLVKRIFEYYVQRMYDINSSLLLKCSTTFKNLDEKPRSIEHLYKIRDFCDNIQKYITELKSEIHIMFIEYDLLDNFFYNISDSQFDMKWQVFAWPHKILTRVSTIREEQKDDFEEFLRAHNLECTNFEEHLENLNDEIQILSLRFDPDRAIETGVEVKKLTNVIADYQAEGELLQRRHKLFGLSDYSLKFLYNLKESFAPYRDLWTAINDFIKLEEATIGNPLLQIDLKELVSLYDAKRKILHKSYKTFEEKPELQDVAHFYLDKMKKFKLISNCILHLRSEYWLSLHWVEYAERSGTETKYSASINFLYLIRKGILQHLDLVREIAENAEREVENIKRALQEEERLKEEQRLAVILRKARRKCRNDIW